MTWRELGDYISGLPENEMEMPVTLTAFNPAVGTFEHVPALLRRAQDIVPIFLDGKRRFEVCLTAPYFIAGQFGNLGNGRNRGFAE